MRPRSQIVCNSGEIDPSEAVIQACVLRRLHQYDAGYYSVEGKEMIIVNMPGGAVQEIGESELLWLRKAFDSEWKGATMLRLGGDRIYSIETVKELSQKFEKANVPLAEFSAPDVKIKLVVSAKRAKQVVASDPAIYHEKAKAVLDFGGKIKLAVRETPAEAKKMLKAGGAGEA